jgi:hypothetical protein
MGSKAVERYAAYDRRKTAESGNSNKVCFAGTAAGTPIVGRRDERTFEPRRLPEIAGFPDGPAFRAACEGGVI